MGRPVAKTPAIALLRAIAFAVLLPGGAHAGINVWTTYGPSAGFDEFRIDTLAIDPHAPSTVYAGTVYDGAFKTTDGGSTWGAINFGLRGSVYALAIDPSMPTTLYAGTDPDGVFKSTDSGRSWAPTNRGLRNKIINVLAVDPTETSTVYAGIRNALFKSVDGGATWSASLEEVHVFAIAIDPIAHTTVYAGTLRDPTTDLGAGLFKSTDAGTTWRAAGLADSDVFVLAIDPTSPEVVYAGTVSRQRPDSTRTDRGVHKSNDGGASWKPAGLMDKDVYALAIDPAMPTTLYAGTHHGVFKSKDGSTSWAEFNAGLTDAFLVFALAIDPITPRRLYAGMYEGGVFSIEQTAPCTGDCSGTASSSGGCAIALQLEHVSTPGLLGTILPLLLMLSLTGVPKAPGSGREERLDSK